MNLIPFCFDFETRSMLDLTEVGGVKYAMHSSTQVTAISFTIGDGPVIGWDIWQGSPIPRELDDVMANPHKYLMVAHNIEFDYLIWTIVFSKLFRTYTRPQIANLHDNMAASNYFRLGSTLEACANMLRLPLVKDKKGRAVMMYTCKPNKNGEFVNPKNAEDYAAFKRYYMGDTHILRMAFKLIPQLPAKERKLWEWTFKRNLTGVRVDVELLEVFNNIINEKLPPIERRFQEIVGCSSQSHAKILEFFKNFYPWIVDFKKDTVEQLLLDMTPVPEAVREALEIKFLLGGTALSKVATALNTQVNGRIYQLFDYSKAQNKRFAGRGVQPQNFPRFDKKRRDKIDLDLMSPFLAYEFRRLSPDLTDALGAIKNFLRRIWIAEPGRQFIAGDFSKIEPTVLFWLLNMGEIPDKWYEEMAAEVYKLPIEQIDKESDERQVGKTAQLSCGYGSGAKAFRVKTFQDTGILLSPEMATKTVNTYRTKYPKVVKMWDDLEKAFHLASNMFVTTYLFDNRVVVMPMPKPWKGVMIQLPSGTKLYYHNTSTREISFKKKVTDIDSFGNKVIRETVETKLRMSYIEPLSNGVLRPKAVYGGLMCVAEGTKVLTSSGWKPIEQVTSRDLVWDGVEWVTCDGAVFNGVKNTIEAYGARFTPDHKILTTEGWRDASQSKKYPRAESRLPDGYKIPWFERYKVYMGSSMRLWERYFARGYRTNKETSEESTAFLRMPEGRNSISPAKDSRVEQTPDVPRMEVDEMSMYPSNSSCVGELRGSRYHSVPRMARKFREFLSRYGGVLRKRFDLRSNRQREGLLQGELQVDNVQSASEQPQNLQKVYDVLNCGPRSRFVVLAGGRPLIVHNCENAVSCIAREVMVEAMLRLEEHGMPVLGSVHDEAWGDIAEGEDEKFKHVMSITPAWARGLVVKTDIGHGGGYRYGK